MKKNYFFAILIACLFCVSFVNSQNLDWTNPLTTGTGNASIAILASPPSVLLNNDIVTTQGALVGAFYENDSGNLICGGYVELNAEYMNGGSVNIAAWGTDAGEDNGFAAGETMQFYLNLNGVDYPANDVTFMMGDMQFEANGLYVISEINFALPVKYHTINLEQIGYKTCQC